MALFRGLNALLINQLSAGKFVLAASLLALLCAHAVHAEVITLVADEWAPYNIRPGKKPEGYMVDVAREVFETQGIKVEYRMLPWKRAIEDTRKGQYNGVIGAYRNDAPDFLFPKEHLAFSRQTFWVKKGNQWRYHGIGSLDKIALGLVAGYDYGAQLNQYAHLYRKDISRIQFVHGENAVEKNLRKLLAGRIDATVDHEDAIRYTSHQLGISERIVLAGAEKNRLPCYIAFSPAHPRSAAYACMLSDGIAKLRKSGKLQTILEQYGLKDWEKK